MHVRNPDAVKKTAKTYLAARKDDLVLWESLGWFMAAQNNVFTVIRSKKFLYIQFTIWFRSFTKHVRPQRRIAANIFAGVYVWRQARQRW